MTFDPRALTEPVNPAEVRAFTAELRARNATGWSATYIILAVTVGVLAVPMFGVVSIAVSGAAYAIAGPGVGTIVLLLSVLGSVAVIAALVWWVVARARKAHETRYRLNKFARANGMSYLPLIDEPPLPGMVFQATGRSRKSTDVVRGTQPRFVEFGNYQYTTGSGKDAHTHYWGYVAINLDAPLPNIVLDALGNNTLVSNLPAHFQREQHLSLEGNFDSYFTLYCPAGYERDALYLFTPDIMARFIDHAAQLDVEIVDNWLFLYTKRQASTLDPATWAWLFGAVGALLTKLDQWARWRDDRLRVEQPAAVVAATPAVGPQHVLPFAPPAGMLTPPPGVAPPGRRLKRGVPWVAVIAALILFLVFLVPVALFVFLPFLALFLPFLALGG